MKIQLIHDDCLNAMASIESKSIDMVLCDLPYGTTTCNWDVVIPFENLWAEYKRITKPNTAILLFGAEPFSSMLRMSNIKLYKYDWIWKKNRATGFLNAKKQPLRNYEIVSVFYANQPTYNPQFSEGTPYKVSKKPKIREKGTSTYGKFFDGENVCKDNDGFRYPQNCLDFDFSKKERGLHPTQKPVELLRYLIRTYTNAGALVLDNCMGSGSTGVAAVMEGRRFIGIEKDEKYFEISKKRIEEASKSLIPYLFA